MEKNNSSDDGKDTVNRDEYLTGTNFYNMYLWGKNRQDLPMNRKVKIINGWSNGDIIQNEKPETVKVAEEDTWYDSDSDYYF